MHALFCLDRSDIDDAAGAAPLRRLDHQRYEGTADKKRTDEIDVDDPTEFLHRDFPKRRDIADDAGIVDENIEPAEFAAQFGGSHVDAFRFGNVDTG